jgi:hypothetical protein
MASRISRHIESGGNTVFLNKNSLGFSPGDTHRNFQISCKGLGGGTYTVSYIPVDCDHIIEFQANATESAAVVMSQSIDFLYETLIITFAGIGVNEPVVHATFWPRPF